MNYFRIDDATTNSDFFILQFYFYFVRIKNYLFSFKTKMVKILLNTSEVKMVPIFMHVYYNFQKGRIVNNLEFVFFKYNTQK